MVSGQLAAALLDEKKGIARCGGREASVDGTECAIWMALGKRRRPTRHTQYVRGTPNMCRGHSDSRDHLRRLAREHVHVWYVEMKCMVRHRGMMSVVHPPTTFVVILPVLP